MFVNAGTAWLFASGRKGDLNVRGAFLHMAADAGVTVGVIVAALLIMWTGWQWLDPAVSLAIAVVILVGTWGLLRDSVNLSLDAVPEDIDPHEVEAYLAGQPGVSEVHDLHIWGMSTTETALTAHLVRPGAGRRRPARPDAPRAARPLRDRARDVPGRGRRPRLPAGAGAGRVSGSRVAPPPTISGRNVS